MEISANDFGLGEIPLISGVLTDTDDLNVVKANFINAFDVIELRVDMFNDLSLDHVKETFIKVREALGKPIIGTVRDMREGGQKEVRDRLIFYETIVPLAELVDIEIQSEDILTEVKNLCLYHKRFLIGSYHNFESTPDNAFLDNIVSKAKGSGVDIVKIAVMPQDREDLIRLLTLTLRHRDKGVITMSMGDIGLPSRVFSPVFGSLITYGYINQPSAPGQLSVSELMHIFRQLNLR